MKVIKNMASGVIVNSLLILTFAFVDLSIAKTHRCSGSHNGQSYCTFESGSSGTKIIITSAHGGSITPSSLPDRTHGCVIGNVCSWNSSCQPKSSRCNAKLTKDLYTKEIAIALAEEIQKLTGKRPHLVINQLHRKKLDANREIHEATSNNPATMMAYKEFQDFIKSAKSLITGNGILFDIHGQTHKADWTEFGYLLSRSQLNGDITNLADSSSIKALDDRSSYSFYDIVKGYKSLGYYLRSQGYKSVPSPWNQSPGRKNYFSGGYNTKTHGSRDGFAIDAVQIEAPKSVRARSTYKAFSSALARAIVNFMRIQNY